MMNKKLLTLIAVAAVPFAMRAALIDFNGGSELSNDFAGFSDFSQSTTGGLDNSGSVSLTSNSQIAVYQTSFDASALSGGTVVSSYFQYNGASDTGRGFAVGFTSGPSDTYDNSSTTTGTDLRVVMNGSGAGDNYGISIFSNGSQVAASSTNVTLVDTNWYYLDLKVGGISGGDYTGVQAELFASDASGVLGSSLKNLDNNGGGGYTVTNALTSDTQAYGFFGGQNPTARAASTADNFTVIPEPSTFALVGLALGALMLSRRRK
jgi:hypothetical protein